MVFIFGLGPKRVEPPKIRLVISRLGNWLKQAFDWNKHLWLNLACSMIDTDSRLISDIWLNRFSIKYGFYAWFLLALIKMFGDIAMIKGLFSVCCTVKHALFFVEHAWGCWWIKYLGFIYVCGVVWKFLKLEPLFYKRMKRFWVTCDVALLLINSCRRRYSS